MINAYKNVLKDYDNYNTIFPTLETIYIGDTGADLTVTKVFKTDEEGMKILPSVTVTTKNNGISVSQTYIITAERGNIDLSNLKIIYTAKGMSNKKHNVNCYYADLKLKEAPWFIQLTDSVTSTISDSKLILTFGKSKAGKATIDVQFAKADWSGYDILSDPVLNVYYNEKLVY